MRATKLVISIKNLTYKDRLKRLKLPTSHDGIGRVCIASDAKKP